MYNLPDNNAQATRQCRRLYVGNLPVGIGLNEKVLLEFFNTNVTSLGVKTPNPVLSVWLQTEGTFCFVEFRSVADTTNCMSLLQGITLGGRQLRVGRPAGDYKPPPPGLENYVVGFPPGTWASGMPGSVSNSVSPLAALNNIPSSTVTNVNGSNFSNAPPAPLPQQQQQHQQQQQQQQEEYQQEHQQHQQHQQYQQ